jgi:NAD(P)H-quinone oxidoreductase subunit 5
MPDVLPSLLALIGPLVCITVAVLPRLAGNRSVLAMLAPAAGWVAVAFALSAAAALLAGADGTQGTAARLVRLDALSASMLLLVAGLGLVVLRYSRTYLAGHPRRDLFLADLALTVGAVQVLVIAGDLVLLAAAWIATSLALHRLLVFFPERIQAQLAARKKFVLSRLGDLCVIAATVILATSLGTTALDAVLATARQAAATGVVPAPLAVAAVLVAVAALLKSAQVPFHVWVPEVMETPTPVSALLHAGIINAGGYLAIRLADLVLLSDTALLLLAVFGAATALFGAAVMQAQTGVKVALAWSTIAQMGFMTLQCGLGAFHAAFLHIVAHGLYKAHAFLAAGSVLREPAAATAPPRRQGRLALWLGFAALAVLGGSGLFGVDPIAAPGPVLFGLVLAFGLVHLVWHASFGGADRPALARGVAIAAAVALGFVAAQTAAGLLLAGAVPVGPGGPAAATIAAVVGLAAALLVLAQAELPHRAHDPRWQAAYVHLASGLYLDVLANRFARRLLLPAAAKEPAAWTP